MIDVETWEEGTMHPVAQQEMMSVEKYRQTRQAEKSQQINFVADLRSRQHLIAALLKQFIRLLTRPGQMASSNPVPFEEAVDRM